MPPIFASICAVSSRNHDAAVHGALTGNRAGEKREPRGHLSGAELVQLQERERGQGKQRVKLGVMAASDKLFA